MDDAKQGKILILSQIVWCILDIQSGPDHFGLIDHGPTELLPSATYTIACNYDINTGEVKNALKEEIYMTQPVVLPQSGRT